MTSKTLTFVVVVVALAAGLAWYKYSYPSAPIPATELSNTSPYTEHAQYYDISIEFPSETSLSGAANDAAIARMKGYLSELVDTFKKDGRFATLTSEDIRMRGFDQGRKESLKVLFFESVTPNTDAYVFTIYEDTGGAHGNTTFKTFMFNKNTGAELSLADLFQPGTRYLDELSQLSRAKLPATIGEYADANMIANGTTPEEQNFSNFVFDGKDLLILFAPYQVAAYAQGPVTLRLPISELAGILKPTYP